MTTDELIAKLLDGTLTAGEHSQMQAMIAASPELAEEIRQLRAIEDMLAHPHNEQVHDTAPFLHSVEDKIAASLVATGGAASAVRMGNLPRALFTPVLVLIGSIGVFFAVRPSTDTHEPLSAATRNELPPSFEMPVPAVASHKATSGSGSAARPASTNAPSAASAIEDQQPSTPPVAAATTPTDDDASATIYSPPVSLATRTSIEQNQEAFDKAMSSGDKLKALVPSYRLGVLYRRAGDSRAMPFLATALAISREKNQQQYEAMSLGELGLLAREKGNIDAANSYLRDCISLLEQLDDAKLLKEWRDKAAR